MKSSEESVVISVRLKRDITKTLEEFNIDPYDTIKVYLEDLAKMAKAKSLIERMEADIKKYVKPSKRGFAVKSVREDRDEHH
jgi:uridine kinase